MTVSVKATATSFIFRGVMHPLMTVRPAGFATAPVPRRYRALTGHHALSDDG